MQVRSGLAGGSGGFHLVDMDVLHGRILTLNAHQTLSLVRHVFVKNVGGLSQVAGQHCKATRALGLSPRHSYSCCSSNCASASPASGAVKTTMRGFYSGMLPLHGWLLAGAVQVTAFPGGVHVWVTLGSSQLMYAVGLQRAAAAATQQCPSQPLARTVTREADVGTASTQTTASSLHRRTANRVDVGAGVGASAGRQAVRSGMLRVDGPQAVYVALE
jgi:hypothetical protein